MQSTITVEQLIRHVDEAHRNAYGIGFRDGYRSGKSSDNVVNNDHIQSLQYSIEHLKELYDPKKPTGQQ